MLAQEGLAIRNTDRAALAGADTVMRPAVAVLQKEACTVDGMPGSGKYLVGYQHCALEQSKRQVLHRAHTESRAHTIKANTQRPTHDSSHLAAHRVVHTT